MSFKQTIVNHKTDIFMGIGLASMLGAIFFTAKGTIKASEVLDEHNNTIKDIKEASELNTEEYTEEDAKKDKIACFKNTAIGFGKCYWQAILLAGIGTGCILYAYGDTKKSLATTSAALTSLSSVFAKYRDRVREDQGEEKDRYYLYGYKKVTKQNEVIDEETGETKIVETTEEVIDISDDLDSVGVIKIGFYNEDGSKNMYWANDDRGAIIETLKSAEYTANIRFHRSNDFFSENEIRLLLGVRNKEGKIKTNAGQVFGWSFDPEKYISFGIDWDKDEQVRLFKQKEIDYLILNLNIDPLPIIRGG